jgi:hypothetical protein
MQFPAEFWVSPWFYIVKYDPNRDDVVFFFPRTLRQSPHLFQEGDNMEIWAVFSRDKEYGDYVSYEYYLRCRNIRRDSPEQVSMERTLREHLCSIRTWGIHIEQVYRISPRYCNRLKEIKAAVKKYRQPRRRRRRRSVRRSRESLDSFEVLECNYPDYAEYEEPE